ncbi:MAG TPA: TIR domain-containing protein [Sphingomicrobium sp.]|nr:TIR domain-containing protein [Sphingomicrobium sp.]
MDRQGGDGGEKSPSADYVFVSYARADEKAARAVIDLLERSGLRVWWDGLIPGGERFGSEISDALEKAGAVVVLWSANSKTSHWVQDEASWARDRHLLVPISIDGSEPPLGFRQFQCLDVSTSGIKAGNPAMQRALKAVFDTIGRGAFETARTVPVPPPSRIRLDRRAALAAGGAAAVAVGGFATWRFLLAPEDARANSVAVLPFQNLSGDSGQQYLSDGMAAELRAKLSRNPLLRVVGQASSNAFRDRSESSRAIAGKLRVANLLDGNVRAVPGQVRIAVELIDGESGFSKWSNSFDRPVNNLLQLQSDIADAVSAALSAELGGGDEPRERSGGTSDVAAFDFYLRGKELFVSQHDEASDRGALAQFANAVRRDPDYAAARAARSRSLSVIANQYAQADERRRLYRQAVAEARAAIRSADSFADGYVALGYALFYGMLDIGAAEIPYQKAHDLGDGNADVLSLYALYRARRRQFDRAFPVIEQAQSLDPINAGLVKTEGRIHFASADYPRAIRSARRALDLNPKLSGAHGDIGNALLMLGRMDEAAIEFANERIGLLSIPGRAIVAIRRRDPDGAREAFDELVREEGDNGLYQQAQILAQWNKKSESLDTLDRALREQDSGLVYLLSDPFLAPLHEETRFKSLLRTLHFV